MLVIDRALRFLLALSCCLVSCGALLPALLTPHNDTDDTESPELTPSATPTIEATQHFSLALGGVALGRDELVLLDTDGNPKNFLGHRLTFSLQPEGLLGVQPRVGAEDYASGSGVRLVPQSVGAITIMSELDRTPYPERYTVTIPPQELIRILLGEARGIILQEAAIQHGVVSLASRSITAEALGAVIRNRIQLILAHQRPSLFAADPAAFVADTPASHYTAVIEAQSLSLYQFSPVHPDDPSHSTYEKAQVRDWLGGPDQLAYDQAVLTAAGIYDETIADPTGGAFGFRTPTDTEYHCLAAALITQPTTLSSDCGPVDANFPALAPVQILLHPLVHFLSDGRPAFIFYRTRAGGAPLVTTIP